MEAGNRGVLAIGASMQALLKSEEWVVYAQYLANLVKEKREQLESAASWDEVREVVGEIRGLRIAGVIPEHAVVKAREVKESMGVDA